MIHTILTYDAELNQGVKQQTIRPALFSHDSQAHQLRIRCTRDGQPAQLDSASVTGYFLREDGSTVPLKGQAQGSCATCTLPASCYAHSGRFSLVIKLNQGDTVNTIFWGIGEVNPSRTDQLADNERLLPSLSELLEQIAAMESATAAANAAGSSASQAAARAEASASAATQAASKAEAIANLSAQAATLEAGQQASAAYENGTLRLGIPKGADGKDGIGIRSTAISYQAGDSPTSAPTESWAATPPKTSAAKPYLWTKTTLTYTDSSSSTAYSVSSSMDSVQVGGRNLLKCSALTNGEPPRKNWIQAYHNSMSSLTYTSEGLHFTTDENGTPNSNGPGFVFSRDLLGLKTGDTVTFSADVKGTLGTGNPNIGYWASSPTSQNSWARAVCSPRLSGISATGYTRFSLTITLQDLYEEQHDDQFAVHGAFNADLYVKNIKLERGNTATDWTPAPEDVDEAISGIHTQLDQICTRLSTIESRLGVSLQ